MSLYDIVENQKKQENEQAAQERLLHILEGLGQILDDYTQYKALHEQHDAA